MPWHPRRHLPPKSLGQRREGHTRRDNRPGLALHSLSTPALSLPWCLPNSDPPFSIMYPSCLLTLGHSPQNSPDARSEIWLGFPRGSFPPASPADTPHDPQVRIPLVSARSPPPAGATTHPAQSPTPPSHPARRVSVPQGEGRGRRESPRRGRWLDETRLRADRARSEDPERASERERDAWTGRDRERGADGARVRNVCRVWQLGAGVRGRAEWVG